MTHPVQVNSSESSDLFTFGFHKQPISSIDWCPFEDSMIAVSSADDSVTVWDLSATHDDDEPQAPEDSVTKQTKESDFEIDIFFFFLKKG